MWRVRLETSAVIHLIENLQFTKYKHEIDNYSLHILIEEEEKGNSEDLDGGDNKMVMEESEPLTESVEITPH